jgi:hypothetical protein
MRITLKSITIYGEQKDEIVELTEEMKQVLDQRLQEDRETYISAYDSIAQPKKKMWNVKANKMP